MSRALACISSFSRSASDPGSAVEEQGCLDVQTAKHIKKSIKVLVFGVFIARDGYAAVLVGSFSAVRRHQAQ